MEPYNLSIQENFSLPIEYTKHECLEEHISNDLEFSQNNIISNIYDSSNTFLHEKLTKFYTKDVKYLKQMQTILKNPTQFPLIRTNFMEKWVSFVNEPSFKEKYAYVEWEHLEFCNKSSEYMQIISVYNLMSPVISLLIPIIFLIFPFVILKFVNKVPITFYAYKTILYENMKNNIVGQFIREFSHQGNYDKKCYVLMGLAFYVFTIYQNILACMKFYNNVSRIKKMLYETKQHIGHFINVSDAFQTSTKKLSKFKQFNETTQSHKECLQEFYANLDGITSDSFSWRDVNSFGSLLSTFYNLYDSEEYNNSLCYSFGFLEYIHFINNMKQNVSSKRMHLCKFSKSQTKLYNQYYLPHIRSEHTKNTIDLTNNYIITGPNASGKTTLLKSTLINIILSQQYGVGCYSKAIIQPYAKVLSYLNIPDTSGRDSLFQAEARRCLDILKKINKTTATDATNATNTKKSVNKENSSGRCICIFDELYSGTNPEEAYEAAHAYLSHIATKNVTFLLTTHYYKLCNLDKIYSSIKNIHMDCNELEDKTLEFTYKVKPGISNVKGGVNVLRQMNYPTDILENL